MVGRSELMCDIDEKWNGPPPRCEPVYCEEPPQIRHGGFSLSTNSTRFGTVASYYCTSSRHKLVGNPKLLCRPDGSWDAEAPTCRLDAAVIKRKDVVKPQARPTRPNPTDFQRPLRPTTNSNAHETGGTFIGQRPVRPNRNSRPPQRPLAPVDNEIPDSVNVQANPSPGASLPNSVADNYDLKESKQAQLNLGKKKILNVPFSLITYVALFPTGGIIALGVFGGFVFLAAIITTIVILIRR